MTVDHIAGAFFGMGCVESAVNAHLEWAIDTGALRLSGMVFPPCLGEKGEVGAVRSTGPVSYTHLTLPTKA